MTASLKEIIEGRRKLKREWSFPEFAQLCKNLLKGLLDLHKAGFIHNDIRPSSIYYSSDKMCYLIGNFSNLMRREEENLKITFKNSNHYRDHVHLHGKKGDSQSTREETSVCDSLDVYALGITLLSAFYLC